jgi:hypothetical protein
MTISKVPPSTPVKWSVTKVADRLGISDAQMASQAGALSAAGISIAGFHPVDRLVKTIQTKPGSIIMDTLRSFGNPYRGAAAATGYKVLANGVRFGGMPAYKGAVANALPDAPKPAQSFAIGSMAGLAEALVTTPVEVVKVRRMVTADSYSNIFSRVFSSPQEAYKGVLWTGARNVVGTGTLVLVTDQIKSMQELGEGDRPTETQRVVSSTVASAAAVGISFPIDTVKVRVQTGQSLPDVLASVRKTPLELVRGLATVKLPSNVIKLAVAWNAYQWVEDHMNDKIALERGSKSID